MDETVCMQSAQQHRQLRAQRLLGCRGFLARLLEVGICPLGPKVIWDLHRTCRAQSPTCELNGSNIPIPKLRRRHLVRWAMRRQVVEGVMKQGLVCRAVLEPIHRRTVRVCPPHT